MANSKMTLTVVSQEKELLSEQVDSVTVPGGEGEMTILPMHLPLFTQLQSGVVTYRNGKEEQQLVVSKGFIDVGPNSQIMVIVDTATHARDISEAKAQKAIEAAHQTMSSTQDRRELLLAEASLRQALLEIRVARNSKKSQI